MSEEEKEALEFIKINNKHRYCDKNDVDFLLNLIEKQQKELNNIKEIEQSHQEENGKLRVELEQEKEKNKELEKYKTYYEEMEEVNKKFIAVDKIKEKIEEVQARMGNDCIALHDFQREAKIDVLKELLEEI